MLKLPPVTLPVADNAPKVPTLVIFVCAAVVNVPAILVPLRLPPVMLPVALSVPVMLAPVVVVTSTLVPLGAKLTLPLAPVMIDNAPVSTILPVTFKFPPLTLPVAVT